MQAPDHFVRFVSVSLIAICAMRAAGAEAGKGEDSKPGKAAPAADTIAETFTFLQNGQKQTVKGRLMVEAADGGILAQGVDGTLWSIERNELQGRERLAPRFKPLTSEELSQQLLAEYPIGFRTYTTPHYVVCYNTSRAYAQWIGSLLERLYKAFNSYWQNQGLKMHESEFPLPVVVFADRQSYDQASRSDLPAGTGNIVGFYSLRSNRINMFDLTGTESVRAARASGPVETGPGNIVQTAARSTNSAATSNRRGSLREINQMLSQPSAEPLVATIIHEATHQIAFNCGMQTRYADIPLWLCEGLAVYCEAPDLSTTRAWRGIGRVNYPRLERFRNNLASWHEGSLEEMVRDSHRFRDPKTAVDAYADAWALNYYLIKYEPKAYVAYLKKLAEKRPLIDDEPPARLAEFRDHFGDLRKLEQDFLKQMSRVK
jgi:hypothetical protein